MNADERRYKEITGSILGAAFAVSNELGVGYLEKVYENALFADLTIRGLKAAQQIPIKVRYRNVIVGDYIADLIVEDLVLVEIKHVEQLHSVHIAQCLNYLKATGLRLCLLINFGKEKIQYKRLVHNF
jgi:GxxExxY protein